MEENKRKEEKEKQQQQHHHHKHAKEANVRCVLVKYWTNIKTSIELTTDSSIELTKSIKHFGESMIPRCRICQYEPTIIRNDWQLSIER